MLNLGTHTRTQCVNQKLLESDVMCRCRQNGIATSWNTSVVVCSSRCSRPAYHASPLDGNSAAQRPVSTAGSATGYRCWTVSGHDESADLQSKLTLITLYFYPRDDGPSQGRGQNKLFGGGAIAPVVQSYSGGLGLWICPSGVQGQSPPLVRGSGAKPPEAESNLKLREQYCALDLTIWPFWCFQVFRQLLLTCYIPMPLTQKHIHRVPKKEDTKLMAVTLSFLNRFSKFFHCHTQR